MKATEKEFGALDILVNNAGIQHVAKIEDFPIEKWDAIIAINLSSSFHTIRAAMPGMKARKWGRIINIASAHGLVASGEKGAYVAAKHGLVGLTKVVAIEAANDGVTCNAICPGWVLTPLVQQQVDARAKAEGPVSAGSQDRAGIGEATDASVLDAGEHRRAGGVSRRRRRLDHHRLRVFDRRRLDGPVIGLIARALGREPAPRPDAPKRINLALQGGGAHGAFTWGVLDHLLDDGRLSFDGISGTSAGAVNAVMLADGLRRGGPDEARKRLDDFWRAASLGGDLPAVQRAVTDRLFSLLPAEGLPAQTWFSAWSRLLSPYDFNPLNINPLKDLIERFVDFERLRADPRELFIAATNVQTGQLHVFTRDNISAEAVMASACLPTIFRAVEIDGVPYWDGGYLGNPVIFPFFRSTETEDVLIVQINPVIRKKVPHSNRDILSRVQEISFNSSLHGRIARHRFHQPADRRRPIAARQR